MLRDRTRSNELIDDQAARHGKNRFSAGFTVTQVVHDYGDVCQVVTELAMERQAIVTTGEFRELNRCLDDAIAGAVTEYGRANQAAQIELDSEQSVLLTQEMQRHVEVARLALHIIKGGTVSVGGSTGSVLNNSLNALHDLLEHQSANATDDHPSSG
jgi:hypothetical protein